MQLLSCATRPLEGISKKIQRETRIADLTLGGLKVNEIESKLSISWVLGNAGSSDINNEIVIKIWNSNDVDTRQLVGELTYQESLASSESVALTLDQVDQALISTGTLVAEALIQGDVKECNQKNNVQSIALGALKGTLTASFENASVAVGEALPLTIQVKNTGSITGSFKVLATVKNAAGDEVQSLPDVITPNLEPTNQSDQEAVIQDNLHVPGQYKVYLVLQNDQGDQLDQTELDFNWVDPSLGSGNDLEAKAQLNVATDKKTYRTTDKVYLTSFVRNMTAFTQLNKQELSISVIAPDKKQVFKNQKNVAISTANVWVEHASELHLKDAMPGEYKVKAVLTDPESGSSITMNKVFTVIAKVTDKLSGKLKASLPILNEGDTQTCESVVQRSGAIVESSAQLRLQVFNATAKSTDVSKALHQFDFEYDSSASGQQKESSDFSTKGWNSGQYVCVLQIKDQDWVTLDVAPFEVKERPIKLSLEADRSSKVKHLVLVDAKKDGCQLNRNITFAGEVNSPIKSEPQMEAILRNVRLEYETRDRASIQALANVEPYTGPNVQSINPEIHLRGVENKTVNLIMDDIKGLQGSFQVILNVPVESKTGYEQLYSGVIELGCNDELRQNQQVGDFLVAQTEVVEKMWQTDYSPWAIERPPYEVQSETLETLLAGETYTLVDSPSEFSRELKTGQYQNYVIFAEHQSLDQLTTKALRDAVYRGEGLLFAPGRSPENEGLWQVLGLISRYGSCPYPYYESFKVPGSRQIDFVDPSLDVSQRMSFGISERFPGVILDGAQTLGLMVDPPLNERYSNFDRLWHPNESLPIASWKHHQHQQPESIPDFPLVTQHAYGKGKAVYVGFDLLAEASAHEYGDSAQAQASLFQALLKRVQPKDLPVLPGVSVPVSVRVTNEGVETPIHLVSQWPAGSNVDSLRAQSAQAINGVGTESVEWDLPLLAAEETHEAIVWVMPVGHQGAATGSIHLTVPDANFNQSVSVSLNTVSPVSLQFVQEGIQRLAQGSNCECDQRAFQGALHLIAQAIQFEGDANHAKVFEYLVHTSTALHRVKQTDVSDLRLKLTQLIAHKMKYVR